MAAIYGPPLVFGIPQEIMPLHGFPKGRVRIRTREDGFVRAYVKSPNGIREFYIKVENGHWIPYLEINQNITT